VRTVELAGHLSGAGHPATVVALTTSGGAATLDVPVLSAGPARSFRAIRSVRRRAAGFDVVVGHGGPTLLPGLAATAARRAPFVYETIGDPRFWRARRSARLRTSLLLRRADHVVALFARAADALADEGVARSRITVIRSAVDPARFPLRDAGRNAAARAALGVDAGRPVAAVVGALSVEKDPVEALRAVPPDWHVLVAGAGPLRADVEAAAASREGPTSVLGSVADVRPVLEAADVLVLASRTEGVPGVAIQAALLGVPVAAFDVGGCAEVVVDGVTGALVPARDRAALSSAVSALVGAPPDPVPARSFVAARFDPAAVVPEWVELLGRLGGRR
jgi:glycosyltransferase involved in cell wall biosynthesis